MKQRPSMPLLIKLDNLLVINCCCQEVTLAVGTSISGVGCRYGEVAVEERLK